MTGSGLCISRNESAQPRYFQNRIIMLCLPISTLIYQWAIYIFSGLVCLFCCSKIDRWSFEYINLSQINKCRHWEWGSSVSFLGIHNQIFGTVSDCLCPVLWKWKFVDPPSYQNILQYSSCPAFRVYDCSSSAFSYPWLFLSSELIPIIGPFTLHDVHLSLPRTLFSFF